MPRFSANLSLLFYELELSERFKAAKNQGFAAVEIQFPYTLTAASIADLLEENGLKLVLFNVDADDLLQGGEGLASVPEKRGRFRKAVAQTVAYAEILKPDVINVLPGRVMDPAKRQEYLDTFKENLGFALAAFTPLGIKTVFEAINTYDMPGFLIHSGLQMLEIQRQLNQPMLAMQYDIYHMSKMGENPGQFIRRYSRQIGHIQFADNPGRGQPGTGNIDFLELFAQIDRSEYKGWVGAEYNPPATTEESLGWLQHR